MRVSQDLQSFLFLFFVFCLFLFLFFLRFYLFIDFFIHFLIFFFSYLKNAILLIRKTKTTKTTAFSMTLQEGLKRNLILATSFFSKLDW